MSVLSAAQQAACSPDFQISHGNLKTAAELCKFSHCSQSLCCLFRKHLISPKCKIGIPSAVGASNSAPQLIKLRQAKAIRPFDNQSVDVRHVYACFNNRGANQNINFIFHQLPPDLCQFLFIHLPIRNCNSSFWHDFLQFGCGLRHGFHPIVDIINLSAPFQFSPHRLHQNA